MRIVAARGNINEEQMGIFPLAGAGGGIRGRGRGSNSGRIGKGVAEGRVTRPRGL